MGPEQILDLSPFLNPTEVEAVRLELREWRKLRTQGWKVYGALAVLHLDTHHLDELPNLSTWIYGCFSDIELASLFSIPPGARLWPHRDYRGYAINLPLLGDYQRAPLQFFTVRPEASAQTGRMIDEVTELRGGAEGRSAELEFQPFTNCISTGAFSGHGPFLLNTHAWHGVDNSQSDLERLVLSLSGPLEESFVSARQRYLRIATSEAERSGLGLSR